MDLLHAPFDPVALAVPFFVLTIILEIALTRFKAVKAHYETKDTMASLAADPPNFGRQRLADRAFHTRQAVADGDSRRTGLSGEVIVTIF